MSRVFPLLDNFTIFVYHVNMNDTTSRILQSALEVFGTYGYRQTNMSLVAEAAGLSRQALYMYFATKEDLFAALVDYIHAQSIGNAIQGVREAEADGPTAVFYALLWGRYGYFAEHLYARPHGAELVAESSRQCGAKNTEATRRFRDILHDAVIHEIATERLTFAGTNLQTEIFADLLLRAAYGLKGQEPSQLSLEVFRESLRTMTTLLAASLLPQRSIS